MSRPELDARDHQMHRLRNRALRRVLDSLLRAQASNSLAARADELALRGNLSPWERTSSDVPGRRTHGARARLRLVKGSRS